MIQPGQSEGRLVQMLEEEKRPAKAMSLGQWNDKGKQNMKSNFQQSSSGIRIH